MGSVSKRGEEGGRERTYIVISTSLLYSLLRQYVPSSKQDSYTRLLPQRSGSGGERGNVPAVKHCVWTGRRILWFSGFR